MKFPLLCAVFIDPRTTLELNLPQWGLIIRQARCANVLARLGFLLDGAGILSQVPAQPLAHIKSAQIFFERFALSLQWEINCIEEALAAVDVPLVFLKGSAYAIAGNKAAKGRSFSDVDILVPEDRLQDVEIALIKAGWMTSTLDPYDQKYYRQWMHEIPPMRHLKRQTSIDVHHNILPKTSQFCPDAKKLLAAIVSTSKENIWVLAPEDRVLHSATHLFHEGEWAHGFRDLSDLDLMLKEFSIDDNFWGKLLQRARQLNQQIPLYYALRYTSMIFQTQIPEDILTATEQQSPNNLKQKLMDSLFLRALMPDHESCNDNWTGFARWILFVRSHWLKMPIYLIVPHLVRKALRRLQGKDTH
ncbi:MAG: nucleotidyltransferase domain-containing protein [Methylococcaceae bacterium]